MTEQKEKQPNVASQNTPSQESASREPLFGTLLFGGIALFVFLALALIGFWGYRGWQANKEQRDLPSIASLPITEEKETVAPPVEEVKQEPIPEMSPEELLKKTKETSIQILNGGAAKGSAGVVGEALKKDGYTKVTVGNTTGNYTGTTVYFANDLEKEAEILKNALLKSYPKAQVKAALVDNKETSTAPLTVILGKE